MKRKAPFTESRYESSHILNLHGQVIEFNAIAEDFVFTDESDEPEAALFSYTYLRKDVKTDGRPVIFVWDGGPGGSCLQDHVQFFGPWRIKEDAATGFLPTTPPYVLEDNPHCLLDVCDIVLVDPVGTGYGALLNKEKAAKYYSTVGDTDAMADFIESWLTAYDRWNSPLFLCGTSYGTIRCVRVVEALNGGAFYKNGRQRSIAVNGVILVGNCSWLPEQDIAVEDNSAASMVPEGTFPQVLLMPSLASTNWYHHPELHSQSEQDFSNRAWDWGWSVLHPFLASGKAASPEEKRRIAEEMSDYIGINADILLEMDFELTQSEMFSAMLLADKGLDIGIYDSRMTLRQNSMIGYVDPASDDPAMSVYSVAQVAVANSALKEKLGIDFNRDYVDVNFAANAVWDYATPQMLVPEIPKRTHNQCVAAAMRRNENMKLLVATGAYDLCTWSGLNRYTAENSGFPAERTFIRTYPSGHAAFAGESAAVLFEADLRTLFFSDDSVNVTESEVL